MYLIEPRLGLSTHARMHACMYNTLCHASCGLYGFHVSAKFSDRCLDQLISYRQYRDGHSKSGILALETYYFTSRAHNQLFVFVCEPTILG